MNKKEIIEQIIKKFTKFEQVVGITLAGSTAFNTEDNNSDIDIDVYITKEIPPHYREEIAKEFADYMEIDNQFWGPGDEWKLKGSEIGIDIIYLDIKWIKDYLEGVLDKCDASVGYTTCFWHNVVDSKVVYDKHGELSMIQEKYKRSYPIELKKNIIAKNYPILRKNMSSYYYQIEKAIKRDDVVSVNHRTSAMLASYFDIIFAVNEIRHPGEKKLLRFIDNNCSKLPVNMEKNIRNILLKCSCAEIGILEEIKELVDNLDKLLISENLLTF
ncbi:MAG: DUF4037 domain-containing protein [Bacillota bacterium]|nr:DUF4037 domain-containing protein [Bacillota bacterium]